MKGYKIAEDNTISLIEMDNTVGSTSVKIKVNRSSLSKSDIANYTKGKLSKNIVIGRQAVGMISEVGDSVTSLIRGDRVVLSPYIACGECGNCISGREGACDNMHIAGRNIDGYLRDFIVTDQSNVYKLPETVGDGDAIFVENIAAAIATIYKLQMQKGEYLVIVGGSITALILAQVAMYYQAVPIIIDADNAMLELAKKLGVVYTINQVDIDPRKRILAITGGSMSEKLVLIASSGIGVARSMAFVRRDSRIVILDPSDEYDEKLDSLSPIPNLVRLQASISGVNNGYKNFVSAINMLANKIVKVSSFISKEISFDMVPKYLEELIASPMQYIKVVIKS